MERGVIPMAAGVRRLTIIERRPAWRLPDWGELRRYRGLLFTLAWRDVKVRYKQTILGALWAILQPAAGMLAFVVFLHRLGDDGSVPYPLFVYSGLLPWTLFANAVSGASQSVIGNPNLITKVYCPRLLLPISATGAPLVDFFAGSALLAALMIGSRVSPSWGILFALLWLLGLLVAAIGLGALLAALTVAYRDFRYVVPFVVQLGLLLTPSVYLASGSHFGTVGRLLVTLNPLNGLIDGFRESFIGARTIGPEEFASFAVAAAWFIVGCGYFHLMERRFADVI